MTHEEAFLADILADRADETARRIYADWLMDSYDPVAQARGEFIHLQCDLARCAPGDPRPAAPAKRERELLLAHGREWGAPFQRLGCVCWEYRRGFVEGVGLPASALLAQGAALFRAAPIDEIKLYHAGGMLGEVASSQHLARLRVLDLEKNELGDGDLDSLAWSPHLGELRTLLLWSNHVGDAGLRSLLGGLPRLERLDLSGNAVGDGGAESLARSPVYGRLRLLDLSANQIGDAGAMALASSEHAGSVGWIDLAKNPIGTSGQAALREKLAGRVHLAG
ncbi:MAG: TIGR02996 domain-containing protein [Gemmataceae bacterium]|nr:TIGR02996 domain-containing protein [Gemmataceae bacterium]